MIFVVKFFIIVNILLVDFIAHDVPSVIYIICGTRVHSQIVHTSFSRHLKRIKKFSFEPKKKYYFLLHFVRSKCILHDFKIKKKDFFFQTCHYDKS